MLQARLSTKSTLRQTQELQHGVCPRIPYHARERQSRRHVDRQRELNGSYSAGWFHLVRRGLQTFIIEVLEQDDALILFAKARVAFILLRVVKVCKIDTTTLANEDAQTDDSLPFSSDCKEQSKFQFRGKHLPYLDKSLV